MNLKLAVRNIQKGFGVRKVLEGCTHSFGSGVTAVMGPNGCGKSTFLRICALLEAPDGGKVGYFYTSDRVLPVNSSLMRKITLVLPKGGVFDRSVWKNVTFGLEIRGVKRREIKKRAADMLEAVGLYDKRKQNALSLSSGEAQRLSLARAMVIEPQVMLIDEPTSSIDEENTAIIERLILGLGKGSDPPTIVLTTHDRAQAERLAQRIITIKQGKFALRTQTQDLGEEGPEKPGPQDRADGRGWYINPDFIKE